VRPWTRHLLTYRVGAGVLIALGVVLRLRQWWYARSYWLDELAVLRNVADRGYLELLRPLDYYQAAPVGWLWLQRLVADIAGFGERAMRLVPLLFGIALLVLVAWLARILLTPPGALLVLAFAVVNQYLIYYSNEAKQYTSEAFWVTLLLGLAVLITRQGLSRRLCLAYWTVATVGALMSMLTVPVTVVATLILLGNAILATSSIRSLQDLRSPENQHIAKQLLVGAPVWVLVVVPLYITVMHPALRNQTLQDYWSYAYPTRSLWHLGATWAWLRDLTDQVLEVPLDMRFGLLFLLLVAVGVVRAWMRHGAAVALLLLSPWFIGYAASALSLYPMTHRLALFGVPAALLLLGSAADLPRRAAHSAVGPRQWATMSLVALVMYLFALALLIPQAVTAGRLWRQPFDGFQHREQIEYVAAQRSSDSVVLAADNAEFVTDWYAPRVDLPVDAVLRASTTAEGCNPSALLSELSGHSNAWLILTTPSVPSHVRTYRQQLERHGLQVREVPFAGGLLIQYDLAQPPGGPETALPDTGYDCVEVFPNGFIN